MSALWRFNEVRPNDRTRESQVGKFFKSDGDRANPIVREGIQNSLDAADNINIVRVRLAVGELAPDVAQPLWNDYADQLVPHLNAMGDKLPDSPQICERFRFLVFEDFETSGLIGDPGQWQIIENQKPPNGFFGFFRAEGVSNKEGSSRGRHGVGKFVFMAASRVWTLFGLTRRDDGRELLMGTTVLKHHHVGTTHYMPDGFYGVQDPANGLNLLPVEADRAAIEKFKRDFHINRRNESGLTIVVPWLDSEVTHDSLIQAVIEGYFHPILRDNLVVDVVGEDGQSVRIDSQTIREVVTSQGETYAKRVTPRLALSEAVLACTEFVALRPPGERYGPKWSEECFDEEIIRSIRTKMNAGEFVALRVPTRVKKKDGDSEPSDFLVYLQRDFNSSDCDVHFIRQGILVSETKKPRISGLRGLVIIDDGPLAEFLGDAENPAHTEWQSELVRHYSFNKQTIEYVVESIENILHYVSDDQKAPDPLPMKDLFFLPAEESELKSKQKKAKPKPGPEVTVPPNFPPPKPKGYYVGKIDGGFVVRSGGAGVPQPDALEILVAYDTQKGNPFKKYHPADFALGKRQISIEHEGVALECDSNRIMVEVQSDNFEIKVTGFDVNRDIIVKTKIANATSAEEDSDAEAI